jgi:ABC transporter, phosphonate, periplasmic substrate-binding protein
MDWQCAGRKIDGTLGFNGKHEPTVVSGERCPVCDLTRSEVCDPGFKEQEITRFNKEPKIPLWAIAIPLVLVGMGGIGFAIQKIKGGAAPSGSAIASSAGCPFPNCTIKIGAVNFRPTTSSQSPSPGASGTDTVEKPACADAAETQASPTSSPRVRIDREKFRAYLEAELQKKYPAVKVQLDDSLNFTQIDWIAVADKKLADKEWDIAFTVSPLVATTAKEQGYEFAYAANIRGQSLFTSAIFARKDSGITSLGKITPDKLVALGNQNDLVGFYLPIYDLYGTKPKIVPNLAAAKIRSMVLCKQADVGVSQVRSIKDNPKLTLLSTNSVKAGGIYFSPNLTSDAKRILKKTFAAASEEIQSNAGFREDTEPTIAEYERFKQVRLRAQEILKTGAFVSATANSNEVVGRIENIRRVSDREYSVGIRTQNELQYRAIVPDNILKSLSSNPLVDLPQKTVKIVGVKADNNQVLTIGKKGQLTVNSEQ